MLAAAAAARRTDTALARFMREPSAADVLLSAVQTGLSNFDEDVAFLPCAAEAAAMTGVPLAVVDASGEPVFDVTDMVAVDDRLARTVDRPKLLDGRLAGRGRRGGRHPQPRRAFHVGVGVGDTVGETLLLANARDQEVKVDQATRPRAVAVALFAGLAGVRGGDSLSEGTSESAQRISGREIVDARSALKPAQLRAGGLPGPDHGVGRSSSPDLVTGVIAKGRSLARRGMTASMWGPLLVCPVDDARRSVVSAA